MASVKLLILVWILTCTAQIAFAQTLRSGSYDWDVKCSTDSFASTLDYQKKSESFLANSGKKPDAYNLRMKIYLNTGDLDGLKDIQKNLTDNEFYPEILGMHFYVMLFRAELSGQLEDYENALDLFRPYQYAPPIMKKGSIVKYPPKGHFRYERFNSGAVRQTLMQGAYLDDYINARISLLENKKQETEKYISKIKHHIVKINEYMQRASVEDIQLNVGYHPVLIQEARIREELSRQYIALGKIEKLYFEKFGGEDSLKAFSSFKQAIEALSPECSQNLRPVIAAMAINAIPEDMMQMERKNLRILASHMAMAHMYKWDNSGKAIEALAAAIGRIEGNQTLNTIVRKRFSNTEWFALKAK